MTRQLTPILSLLLAATLATGCGLPRPGDQVAGPDPVAGPAAPTGARDASAVAIAPTAPVVPKLPFVGRLVEGERDQLPPAVAAALADNAPVTFAYREELTHEEYHIPLIVSAFDPVTWVGAPLGDFGVTAFATLTVRAGDAVLGDYTAKAYVSRPYTLYSSPTHRELERAARDAVRARIDEKLARDSGRLAQELAVAGSSSAR